MKVIAKQNLTNIHFKNVEPGQIFAYEGEIYMKLDMTYQCHDEHGYKEASWSAVHLETGELCHFDDYEPVELPIKVTPLEVAF